MEPEEKHLEVLQRRFGHKTFRPLQWKIIKSIIEDKRDNCAIIATGYGKSLCYQYPAVFKEGITFVISPLISLMQDQVLALTIANIPSCFLGSANSKQAATICEIFENKYSVVYLTPEFCIGDVGKDMIQNACQKLTVVLIAVDEAHCVSSWGHDFRHSYRALGILKDLLPNVPILAVTATATPLVEKDIVKVLRLKNPQISHSGFDRPNFYYAVHKKSQRVFSDLKPYMVFVNNRYKFPGPTIIYTITRKKTEEICAELKVHDLKSQPYHAGLPLSLRKSVHEDFVKDRIEVVVATIAFGMGIDKPDIRLVIHYGMSQCIESYYQEAGRAGRDGEPAKCIMFYSEKDRSTYMNIWPQSGYNQANLNKKLASLDKVMDYSNTDNCRRNFILSYFENKDVNVTSSKTTCCDNCDRGYCKPETVSIYKGVDENGKYNFTSDIKQFLRVVKTMNSQYGSLTYINFLQGSKIKKLERFFKHETYGCGKDKSEDWWKEIAEMCQKKKFLSTKVMANNKFARIVALTEVGNAFLVKSEQVLEVPSPSICKLLQAKDNIWLGKMPCLNPGIASNENIWQKNTRTLKSHTGKTIDSTSPIAYKDEVLFMKLLEKRTDLAKENDCSNFMIATDATIRQFVMLKPRSLEELKQHVFDGFTEAKIHKFGKHFINIINGNSLAENQVKQSIQDILEKHPLPNVKISGSSLITIKYFLSGKSLNEIASHRNFALNTIYYHLIEGVKAGYPIKLSDFDVTNEIHEAIIDTVKNLDTKFTILNPIKENCPIKEITYNQITAVKAHYQVREHLEKLGIQYHDFDNVNKTNSNDLIPSVSATASVKDDDLSQLINNLEQEFNDDETFAEVENSNSACLALEDDFLSEVCDQLEEGDQYKTNSCDVISKSDEQQQNGVKTVETAVISLSDEDDTPCATTQRSSSRRYMDSDLDLLECVKGRGPQGRDYINLLDSPPRKKANETKRNLDYISILDSPPRKVMRK